MEMDTWYELRFQQIFDLTDRANELLEEVKDTDEAAKPPSAQRVRQPFDLADRGTDLLEGDKGDR
jgi:hypothetical protein